MALRERSTYSEKYRDWVCPGRACKFTLRTLPTQYAPGHRCNPNAPSTHHYLIPKEEQ